MIVVFQASEVSPVWRNVWKIENVYARDGNIHFATAQVEFFCPGILK